MKGSEKGPDIAEKWFLHHDNAKCHTAYSITGFLNSKGIPVIPRPFYYLDLSLCFFFPFSKLKNVLKGRHFGTLETIQKTVTDMLKTITVKDFPALLPKESNLKGITLMFGRDKNFVKNQSHYFSDTIRMFSDFHISLFDGINVFTTYV